MALHKDLTGAELHEPKGADTAPGGTVYVANGAGSGNWTNPQSGNLTLNQYWLQNRMADVSAVDNKVFFFVPVKSEIVSLAAVLDNGITLADTTLTIYVNGVAFTDTLDIPFAGSTAGSAYNVLAVTDNIINPGVVIEVRSNGASTTTAAATIQLGLRAIA